MNISKEQEDNTNANNNDNQHLLHVPFLGGMYLLILLHILFDRQSILEKTIIRSM